MLATRKFFSKQKIFKTGVDPKLQKGVASLSNVENIDRKKLLVVSLCIVNGVIRVN